MAEQNSKESWMQARHSQRSKILNVILGTAVVAGFFVILQSLQRVILDTGQLGRELQFLIPYVLAVLVFFLKALDYRIRLVLPILGIYVAGAAVLIRDGVAGHGVWYLILAPLLVFSLAGWGSGFVTLLVSAAIYGGVAVGHLQGWLEIQTLPDPRTPYQLFNYTMTYVMMLILIGISQGLFNRDQNRTLQTVFDLNESLTDTQRQLQVQHQDLKVTNEILQLQSRILTASAQVMRDVVGLDDVTSLLREMAQSYIERLASYGLAYVGLYVDESDTSMGRKSRSTNDMRGLSVILLASAGVQTDTHKHTARMPDIISTALRSGVMSFNDINEKKTEVADSVEIAVPIMSKIQIQGHLVTRVYALYMRLEQGHKFADLDPIIWDTVGGQLAAGIQNTSLLQDAHRETYEVLDVRDMQAQEFWRDSFAQGTVFSTNDLPDKAVSDIVIRSLSSDGLVTEPGSGNKKSSLAVPIKVRDEVLGVVDIQGADTDHVWSEAEIALVEVVVEQLGLALDSARLYEDSQRRSRREQVTIEVTERIRSTLDVDTILKTAVREIGQVMGLDDLTIELRDVSSTATE